MISKPVMEMINYISKCPAEDINGIVQEFYAILEDMKLESRVDGVLNDEQNEELMIAIELIVQISKDRLNLNAAETDNKRRELINRYEAVNKTV